MVKKWLMWVAVIVLVLFITARPKDAASVTKAVGGVLLDMAKGFGEFFSKLVH